MRYKLLVLTLRFAAWLATGWESPKGILMDAEGDSRYYEKRNRKERDCKVEVAEFQPVGATADEGYW